MKQNRTLQLCLAMLTLMAVGCAAPSAASTGQSGSQATPTPTVLPTATSRPKPTKVPTITMTFCQRVMSVTQANQITHPSTAATSIRAQGGANGGACYYEFALARDTVSLLFGANPGGALADFAPQALRSSVLNGKVTTGEAVSGVGDQAYYGDVTGSLSVAGITVTEKQQTLYVVDGTVLFAVSAGLANGAGGIGNVSDTQALAEFKQIALLVLAQL